jgi:hypothetical protein
MDSRVSTQLPFSKCGGRMIGISGKARGVAMGQAFASESEPLGFGQTTNDYDCTFIFLRNSNENNRKP